MKEKLLDLLACPTCGGDILLAYASKYEDKEIIDGVLTCRKCSREYRVVRGVPRFADLGKIEADKAETAENFGWQWTHFTQEDPKYVDQFLGWLQPVRPGFFEGKVVLEGGCGKGRHTKLAAEWGAKDVVGIDLGDGVESAFALTRHLPNAHIVQCDIFRLPLKRVFDYAFSVGVLHHTPSTERAFRALVQLVKPGGEIAISVYAATVKPGVGWALNMFRRRFLRVFTRRFPKRLMLWWSLYCVPVLWVIDKIPVIRWIRYHLPAVIYKSYPLNQSVLDTFDVYASELESRHRPKEVIRWFREAGLTNIDLLDSEDGWVSVRGQAPAHSSLD